MFTYQNFGIKVSVRISTIVLFLAITGSSGESFNRNLDCKLYSGPGNCRAESRNLQSRKRGSLRQNGRLLQPIRMFIGMWGRRGIRLIISSFVTFEALHLTLKSDRMSWDILPLIFCWILRFCFQQWDFCYSGFFCYLVSLRHKKRLCSMIHFKGIICHYYPRKKKNNC